MNIVTFPGLGLTFKFSPVAFTIGNLAVKWYGIIIAVGLLLALFYGFKRCKHFDVSIDNLSDIVIFSIIFGIIGARLYYVLFYHDDLGSNPYFADPKSIFYIWNGGLGIYGGIIAAFVTAFVVCKIKKISTGAVFDIAALGFLIGQGIGRWGNFVNMEAYGSTTNLPWRMGVNFDGIVSYVHPCFLYESLWCALGFVLLHIFSKKHRKFNGQIFLMYVMWYAFGRFFIEGLRTDSLFLGNIKISQLVAAVTFVAAGALLVYKLAKVKEVIRQSEAEYKPLFEDASKGVENDILDNYDNDEEDNDGDNDDEEPDSADGGKAEDTEASGTDTEDDNDSDDEKEKE